MNQKKTSRTPGTVDWSLLHRRQAAVQTALENALDPPPARKKALLRSRAAGLARPPVVETASGPSHLMVEFMLAGEKYGIDLDLVEEVCTLSTLVPVPCTPPFVLGITSLRGRILSVIDLKILFELPEKGLTEMDKVIVVRRADAALGIRADAVLGTRSLSNEDLRLSLPDLGPLCRRYFKGLDSQDTIVLDIEKLLSDKQIIVHQEVEIPSLESL